MNVLIVVAHPDDEVLGAGATIPKLVESGHRVAVCTLVSSAAARSNLSDRLNLEQAEVFRRLGIEKSYCGDFPNIKTNATPQLLMVQFIESAIENWKAEAIYTHHPSDLNVDHRTTSSACQAAARLFQRKPGLPPLRRLIFMEVPSSTDWSFDSSGVFTPNLFVEIGREGVEEKLKLLKIYSNVMREYPHPRSDAAITGLAAYRGAQAGCHYAEAFQLAFERD